VATVALLLRPLRRSAQVVERDTYELDACAAPSSLHYNDASARCPSRPGVRVGRTSGAR